MGSQALVLSEGAYSNPVVNGETIAPGSALVVSGVTISLPTSATDVIVDGTTTVGLGGAILSVLGIYSGTAPAAAPTATGNRNGNGSV